MNTVTVIGSINMDTTLRLTKAAKRSGARTSFIGGVGTDSEGQQLLDLLTKENIDTSGIAEIEGAATGQAMIMVDAAGENSILIHAGANNA
ncbi:PfkB family carbohydrate kinase, partial [Enterococcus lactis]|uniref:PfkB family carbohydrate kinase n=1 Tax=Enterococcus lactis TaxID=357441 RepID=UPI0022E51941